MDDHPLITVEKRKWDGSVSAREVAEFLGDEGSTVSWGVPIGTRRVHPRRHEVEVVACEELWLGLRSNHVVVCGYVSPRRRVERFEVHAACPPGGIAGGVLLWIDLDLDVDLERDRVEVLDERAFMQHARDMHYPDEVVTAAWAGIASVTPRYVNHEWPFDGFMDELAAGMSGRVLQG